VTQYLISPSPDHMRAEGGYFGCRKGGKEAKGVLKGDIRKRRLSKVRKKGEDLTNSGGKIRKAKKEGEIRQKKNSKIAQVLLSKETPLSPRSGVDNGRRKSIFKATEGGGVGLRGEPGL